MIAYATFAHSPPESLLAAVSEHALLSLSKFEQQAIANLIWALALLHALTPEMWNQLLDAFSSVDDQQSNARLCSALSMFGLLSHMSLHYMQAIFCMHVAHHLLVILEHGLALCHELL